MRDHILLYLNGRSVRVSGDDVFLSLSDFLRRRQRLPGTKVVCAEGDCGSCAVILGKLHDGTINYASVTSCIQLVFQLDGVHVITIEGLRDGKELNPIQKSMVAGHGAQCGFCTPGFVVALYDQMQDGKSIDAGAVRRQLVGNLCRCTGYDSIIQSALATDRSVLKSLDQLYPPAPIVETLRQAAKEEVRIETPTRQFYKPTAIERAARFKADHPGCRVVAGGTDLGVVYNKRMMAIDVALSTAGLAEFRSARVEAGALYIGASASLSTLERLTLQHIPELGRYLAWFGSPLIKNAGTIGGNLVTGSPIGDTLPPLMVLQAEIDLVGATGRRRVPISEFYTGYRKSVMQPDELVAGVRIPLPQACDTFKLYKVSRRKDLDISTFSAAIWMRIVDEMVQDVRIAFGGVGPMVLRMKGAERTLRGKPATLEQFRLAGESAAGDVTPITDVRGSEDYRRSLSRNILEKFWHEVSGPLSPVRRGEG